MFPDNTHRKTRQGLQEQGQRETAPGGNTHLAAQPHARRSHLAVCRQQPRVVPKHRGPNAARRERRRALERRGVPRLAAGCGDLPCTGL